MGESMGRQANSHSPFHALLRINLILALAVMWAALAACAVGALAFDVADWVNAWRELRIDLLLDALPA